MQVCLHQAFRKVFEIWIHRGIWKRFSTNVVGEIATLRACVHVTQSRMLRATHVSCATLLCSVCLSRVVCVLGGIPPVSVSWKRFLFPHPSHSQVLLYEKKNMFPWDRTKFRKLAYKNISAAGPRNEFGIRTQNKIVCRTSEVVNRRNLNSWCCLFCWTTFSPKWTARSCFSPESISRLSNFAKFMFIASAKYL